MWSGCTTCGAGEFRRLLQERAVIESGSCIEEIGYRACVGQGFTVGLFGLGATDRHFLQRLGLAFVFEEASRVLPDLESVLEGTPAGKMMADLRQDAIDSERRRDRRRRSLATGERAARVRRRRRVWERRVRHAARLETKRCRDALLAVAVARFTALDPVDRLKWLAQEEVEIPIDRIPEELLPLDGDPMVLLGVEHRRLIRRIGGRRRNWRLLRCCLERGY
jgi:hypothetical protein